MIGFAAGPLQPLTLVLAGMAVYALLNQHWWQNLHGHQSRSSKTQNPHRQPKVSLLIPARNESKTLPDLLAGLTAQDYPNLEIIVLDDSSSDGTFEVIRASATQDPRIMPIRGATLPSGWLGKPHACHQLSTLASGAILVFVDADTRWSQGVVGRLVEALESQRLDALCAWPSQCCEDPLSKLLQPLQQWSLIAFLPLALVRLKAFPIAVAANGQCLVFRRECYASIGGHAAVRSSVIEDMALARAVKKAGLRFGLFGAARLIETTMYPNMPQAFAGYAKNIYPAFGANPWAFCSVMVFNLVLFVGPWVWMICSPGLEPLGAIFCSLIARFLSDQHNAYPRAWALFHPLGIIAWAGVGLVSWWRYARGNVVWKDRRYDLRPKQPPFDARAPGPSSDAAFKVK